MDSSGNPLSSDRKGILASISRALRSFGSLTTDGGALAQAWMPVTTPGSSGPILQTKGLPYCLVGPGDMLALFRCLSCKYSFSADLNRMAMLGAPGRVFVSGEAETSDNVQQCNVSIYLRVKDAQACQVSSTVLLPVFACPSRKNAVAVLEITQFNGSGVSYQRVFQWAQIHLEEAGLYTPRQLETRTFEMQSHALSIRFFSSRDSALGCLFSDNAAPSRGGVMELQQSETRKAGESPVTQEAETPAAHRQEANGNLSGTANSLAGQSPSHGYQQSQGGTSEEDRDDEPEEMLKLGTGEPCEQRSGSGGQNKAGLTREDLEKHFGVGLKEAALRLGVCNTTLKRACRRHGIMKWPRRELLKAAKMQKESARALALEPSSVAQQMPLIPGQKSDKQHRNMEVSSSTPDIYSMVVQEQQRRAQAEALQRAASSNYQQLNTVSLLPQQHRSPATQTGPGHEFAVAPGAHGSWQKASGGSELASNLEPLTKAEGSTRASPGNGQRRNSLGMVDAIFDGPNDLGSFLGEDWEQGLPDFKNSEDPRPMEQVVGRAVNREDTLCGNSKQREVDCSFPELPDPWPVANNASLKPWDF